MNSWLGRAFVVLAGCFVVFTIYQGARDIGMGKVSSPEAACLLMLIFSFGALMGNYHRNKTLEGVLLTLVYALVAVGGVVSHPHFPVPDALGSNGRAICFRQLDKVEGATSSIRSHRSILVSHPRDSLV
jgi:hypothetical protein